MKLRVWRLKHGYSQQKVADMAGVGSKMNISRYERDPDHAYFRVPNPAHYLKLRRLTNDLVLFDDYLRSWSEDDQAELDRALAEAA